MSDISTSPATVLVTGGGGFLGSAIVRLLVARGLRVSSLARSLYPELAASGVEQIQGDIADAAVVRKACQGRELVFHVAAKPGIWGAHADYYRTNVTGARNVIRACMDAGVGRLIYTSSPSVVFHGRDMEGVDESAPYPRTWRAHYPATKALAEQLVRRAAQEGLPSVILRPHLIWGPGDNHLVPRILARARRLRQVGDGRNLVDTIYIDNAAQAHLLAADRLMANPALSGRVYFISQGEPIRLWEMINHILAAGGHPPVRKRISADGAILLGTLLENIYRLFNLRQEPPMTRFLAEELATSHWFDITAARRDLGYVPQISTSEGLLRLKKWLQAQAS